ncbi:Rha family transcriptional regulator [Bartonella machadoae]|uniref:Rha family transcriptional regulator n=1 Tax=Bartonella machadoae TaxID=2893471 RepID=UPI001F4D0134|nr:Rha family transcriptional regulator [Bartonella machadoae]UNE54390.1 Rha family transcriptional regulator [Bartonella machadoae]UNE54462.1 Rha family transcriptional regulator [Bartonella machadoae]
MEKMRDKKPFLRTNIAVTTSLKIAEGVRHTHKTVMQLVRQNIKDFEEFGSLAFEMRVSRKG